MIYRTKAQSKFCSLSVGNTTRLLESYFRTGIIPVNHSGDTAYRNNRCRDSAQKNFGVAKTFCETLRKKLALETQAPSAVICSVFLLIRIYREAVATNTIPLPSAPLFSQPAQPLNLQVRLKPRGTYAYHT